MTSGGNEEGNCRICGSYTKGSRFKWEGLCLSCSEKLKSFTKEELLYEISQLKKQIWNLTFFNKKTNENFINEKE
jgi:hypothetical protein